MSGLWPSIGPSKGTSKSHGRSGAREVELAVGDQVGFGVVVAHGAVLRVRLAFAASRGELVAALYRTDFEPAHFTGFTTLD